MVCAVQCLMKRASVCKVVQFMALSALVYDIVYKFGVVGGVLCSESKSLTIPKTIGAVHISCNKVIGGIGVQPFYCTAVWPGGP